MKILPFGGLRMRIAAKHNLDDAHGNTVTLTKFGFRLCVPRRKSRARACNGDVDLQIAAMRLGQSATAPPRTNQTRSFQGKCLRKPRDTARINEGDLDLWANG